MDCMEGLQVVVIACKVFQGILETRLPANPLWQVVFLDYGLHRIPRKLKQALQDVLDGLERPSLVILGYGLCGNGLDGIKAGQHTLVVPRADDCIAILLGSYEAYRREFDAVPGTYYLTKGWLESGSNPLQEHREYVQKYGQEKADWVMDQQYRNYRRLVFVAHQAADFEAFRPQVQEVAEYCARWGMRYEELVGSDAYIRRLIEVAAALEKAGEDFLVVPPGGELTQRQFLR